MAITQIGVGPERFAPAYNEIWFYVNSTNVNEPGFRYIFDLYNQATSTLIGRFPIAPRPGDGYGGFNCSKILSTYLTNQVLIDLMGADPANCYIEYELQIGEEFDTNWDYTDFEFYSNPGDPYNAYVQLRKFSPAVAHPFVVGDQIVVSQTDLTPQWPVISGYHTIVAVPDAYTIVIDLPFWQIGSGPTAGGNITFANNSKTLTPDLLNIDDQVLFNGAISHELYRSYDDTNTFGLTTGRPGQAITTCPFEFSVRTTTRMGFNWWNDYDDEQFYLYCMNDTGTIKRVAINDATNPMNYTPVGASTINSTITSYVSGPVASLITASTEWYQIWSANAAGQTVSQIYTFNINRMCTNYREYEVVFLDRLGSMGSFSFIFRNDENMTVQRENHKFMLGDLADNVRWTYATTDAGTKNINIDVENTLTMRTQWLTDEECLYIAELVSSPVIWIAEAGGEFFPAVCTDPGTPIERHPETQNIKKTLNFKYANNNIINI